MADEYDIGDVFDLRRTILDSDGVLADPDTVTFTLRKPDGVLSTLPVTHVSPGVYQVTIDPDQAGVWWFGWATTGDPKLYDEDSFTVRHRRVQ